MAERGGPPRRAQGIAGGVAGTWPPRGTAQAGGFAPSGFDISSLFAAKLREWVRAEVGAGRVLPCVPVAYGIGIALYLSAVREPVLAVAVITAVALCAAAFLLRRHK